MNQGTNLGSQIGRWIVLAAVVALLGSLLLTIRPVVAQSTGDCEKIGGELQCSYVEHSTGQVNDFHADTAGAEIAWTLVTTQVDRIADIITHPDHGDFRIDQETGVLSFKSPPNYESPVDSDTNNIYKVMVRVEVDTDAGRTTTDQGVSVNVTNKEEDGSVSLNNLQPQVRELLTATLSDPDDPDDSLSVGTQTWQWSWSSSRNSGYEPIDGANADTYRPLKGDTGMYLRAAVTYVDGHGAKVDSAMTESAEPVRAETGVDNTAPVFAEDEDGSAGSPRTATREIDENTPGGTNIGPPVFATDDDLDVLTYSLSGGGDQGKFAINAETGQIMTKASLNYEAASAAANNCAERNSCEVIVTVKDPLGNRVDNPALDTITVTITVKNLNEAPTVSGPVLLIRHPELNGDETPVGTTELDTEPSVDEVQQADFTARDQESTEPDDNCTVDSDDSTCSWELEGPDASSFTIGDGQQDGTTFGRLAFKNVPDFEKPGDANKANVYQVTVVARDSQLATGSRDVTIRVTNEEELGTVSLSHTQPEDATLLTATLTDPDGGIMDKEWQWMRDTIGTPETATQNCNDVTDANFEKITGKTDPTYTPARVDVGKCLRVTATYDDAVRNRDLASTVDEDESEPTVVPATSANPVRAAVSPNDPPYFEADGTATPIDRVTAYTRYIRENRDTGTGVSLTIADAEAETELTAGADVTATDVVNDDDDITTSPDPTDIGFLQYELDGASKDYFKVVQSGDGTADQMAVIQTTKMLNREDKDRHTVTVKATDPSGGTTATATVTIHVVDEDEAPEIDDAGPMHVEYMENGTAAVANYMAKDPEGTGIEWTVLVADAAHFKVTQEAEETTLAFKKAPDFETPTGGTDTDSNIYSVMLTAAVVDAEEADSISGADIVDDEMDTVSIMVGVTDVEEDPVFSEDSDTLTVKEHTKTDDNIAVDDYIHRNVGSPVTAKDSDGIIHLTYSLSGTDAGYFTIVPATGQIKTTKKLDYEMKNSFSVVVTATDPTDRKDTINIAIEVDDVAEAPDIVPDGVTVSGESDVDYNENDTVAVGTYTVEGPEAASPRWTREGPDASHFMLDGTGTSTMLKFRSAPDFEMPRGRALSDTNTNTYMVTVMASAGGETDMVEVTITVDNVEEDGTVTLNPSRPSVGTEITATLEDDDIVSSESWQWASSDAMDGTFTNISGATSATYTPVAADADMWLRAMATYTDVLGSGNVEMKVTDSAVTLLAINGPNAVDRAENGTSVATYTADSALTITWTVSGDDAGAFNIRGGQLTFSPAPDYEAPADTGMNNVYNVTVEADDGTAMDSQDVTVTVSNVNEAGTVTLSTMSPTVGSEVTASLTDLDGSITGTTWQWAKSMTMGGTFTDIGTATSAGHTPVEDDAGMYLRATATYDDGHGTGKMAMATTTSIVTVADPLLAKYDTNTNNRIDRSEVIAAIDRYLAGEAGITRAEVIAVIDLYLGD